MTDLLQIPEVHALFVIKSPLDVIAPTFVALVIWTACAGTYTFLKGQVVAVYTAVTQRRPRAIQVGRFALTLIDGSCDELQRLRSTYTPSRRVEHLASICQRLQGDSSLLARSMLKQFHAYLENERKLARADAGKFRVENTGKSFHIQNQKGGEA